MKHLFVLILLLPLYVYGLGFDTNDRKKIDALPELPKTDQQG